VAKWGGVVPGTEYFTVGDMGESLGSVMVDPKELEKLKEDQFFLRALMDAGVDNWEGYNAVCLATAELEDPEL
jgi:hypothetical protein